MKKGKTELEKMQDKVQKMVVRVNEKITILGEHLGILNTTLTNIQEEFDKVQNIPNEEKMRYEELKQIRLNWKNQVDEIIKKYEEIKNKDATVAGVAGVGIGAGVAVAALGPGVAMGIATTFGVASTGTAISALSGAAAMNAGLAWIGGGALAAGGGGMAAGEAFLALMGPIGLAIAGVGVIAGGLLFWKNKNDQKCLENLFIRISNRDLKSFELAINELDNRIKQIDNENIELKFAIRIIQSLGLNYSEMTEEQQDELKKYIQLIDMSTQLLVNPIKELQPKYTNEDLDEYIKRKYSAWYSSSEKRSIITLANLLYKINTNEVEKKLLWKSLRDNKEFLKSIDVTKEDFKINIFDIVSKVLSFKY